MRIGAGYFQLPIALSAFLLFLVQPIIAKQILPWFGGSASVWNTCLFFFQLLLLLGYTYAHALVRWASVRQQTFIHVGLLCLSLLSLPVIASAAWKAGHGDPAVRILLLLSSTVGLPYFLLSTTSPLLQAWYARTLPTPYRLFALSNAASLTGLLAYPFVLEPTLTTSQQATLWSAGFVVFALTCAVVAILSARVSAKTPGPVVMEDAEDAAPPTVARRTSWVILSALGSLALVSLTSFVAQNIASMPLIWVVPLAIYLMTFVLAFGGGRYQGWPIAGPALILSLVMVASYQNEAWISQFYWSLPVFMAGLFSVCLYCHGELAASKPDPGHLTAFYILVSLGGALGSLAGSVLAPLVLSGNFEMPITLAAVAAVIAWQRRRDVMASRAPALALAVAIVLIAAGQIAYEVQRSRVLARNFYSALRIVDVGLPQNGWRRMEHGGTEHGSQYLDPQRRKEPISYYGRSSGVALALGHQRQRGQGPLAVGVVGLGTGAIAAYGEPGDRFRFYEINPQVVTLARSQFTYLSDSRAAVSVELGDARLVLEREPPQAYDVLVVDAFSGDAIPMHLLTREAVAIYRKHLKPSGVLLFHISNRFVDLQPAMARLAIEENLEARIVSDEVEDSDDDEDTPLSDSDWVLMAPDTAWMNASDLRERAEALEPPRSGRAWTDDFNNILSAIRLGGTAR